MATRTWKRTLCVFSLGALAGAAALWCVGFLPGRSGDVGAGDGDGPLAFAGILRQASAELGQGDYEFFPNRRSIWIVNRVTGRMALYRMNDDEVGSVDRSRVATIDMTSFPREHTVIRLSDRNMNEGILWVCNQRTGDVQMWTHARDASLRAETPIASSTDLSTPSRPAGAARR
jgi:hypothetical protein